jgi:hypothetical protein
VREGEGVAAQVLVSLGVDLARVRQQVIHLLSEHRGQESVGAARKFSTTLTGGELQRGELVECSFCGRRPPETGKFVSGHHAYICEHCVAQWSERHSQDNDESDTQTDA